jgi:orotate phosphoribosyltransferase
MLANEGIALHYLATWKDVIAVAEEGGYFTPQAIAGVKEFLKDPVSWSVAHGGKGA